MLLQKGLQFSKGSTYLGQVYSLRKGIFLIPTYLNYIETFSPPLSHQIDVIVRLNLMDQGSLSLEYMTSFLPFF